MDITADSLTVENLGTTLSTLKRELASKALKEEPRVMDSAYITYSLIASQLNLGSEVQAKLVRAFSRRNKVSSSPVTKHPSWTLATKVGELGNIVISAAMSAKKMPIEWDGMDRETPVEREERLFCAAPTRAESLERSVRFSQLYRRGK